MCLAEVYTDEDMNRIVSEMEEVAPGVVEVWKGVEIEATKQGHQYCPCYDHGCHRYSFPFSKAKQVKDFGRDSRYWSGYHFASSKDNALAWITAHTHTSAFQRIKCYILKEWITAVGRDGFRDYITLVASQAFFPAYPETEAKLEDFLAWLKENDPEYAESQLCEAVK